ncbi:MAG: phospholipase C type enzyme [Phylliscum demangeonii]|nr:MAG: phospholipase C type enzyme [Phylliscum demangeonii]
MAATATATGAGDRPADLAIEIISYNVWGIAHVSTQHGARAAEIGARLASRQPAPDLVGLQECFTAADYTTIHQATRHRLPYAKYYRSGLFGSGLAILSRWPIEESSMHAYALNGRPTAFWRGDWYVGKGVACATLRTGPGANDLIEVFNTHLHAPYEPEPHDSYLCHRTAQAWEMAKLLRAAVDKGRRVVGLGDFNLLPDSLGYRLLTTHAPVRDVWPAAAMKAMEAVKAVDGPSSSSSSSAAENLARHGTTCDSALNTWRWDKARRRRLERGALHPPPPEHTPDPHAKRLDYIFVGGGGGGGSGGTPCWPRVERAHVGMVEHHPTLHCSLSDHFSVEARVTLPHPPPHPPTAPWNPPPPPRSSLLLPPAAYDAILHLIASYTAREQRQRRLRLAHALAQVLLTIGCLLAVWWAARAGRAWAAFVLMVLSSLAVGAAVLEALIGAVFVGCELSALVEWEWEVRNARARAVVEWEWAGAGEGEGVGGDVMLDPGLDADAGPEEAAGDVKG